MKKFDKEYSTQYTPEKDYLLSVGIKPSFVKIINEVICDLNFPIYNDMSLYTQKQLDELLNTFLLIQDNYNSYICINENIHKQFHSIYGYGDNTEEQWNEFVNTYYN